MSILSGPTGGFGGWKDGPKRDYDDKHGRKDDDHDWKSKDDRHDGKDGDKHARKDDCDNDNGNHQDDCQPVCCEPEPDCDVHAALVGMSDVGSVVDFAIDSLSPGQGMDMGQFDTGGATDSLGA
jgi:hypothetical protein